ncbi:MAG TPA: rhomboid family intramembrane serine protease [Rhizomicrobium sp.]|nr:rhomboid family intramembrane serine protease [Rhizomicrobium sp.]
MAFLQSAPPRQPIFRAPAVVLWLIGVLTALHLLRVTRPGNQPESLIYEFGLYPIRYSRAYLESRMANPGTLWERGIPFISYMGVHESWTHLIINSLWLLAFGPIVARRWGGVLFLAFFTTCGVAGAVTYLVFNWASPIAVIGASGAISGLMGAAFRMLPGQAPWVAQSEAPLASIFSRQILVFTCVWTAINLLTGLTGLGMGGEKALVAWQVHLGGYAAGLLLCAPFDRLRPRSVGTPVDR